jgi:hypothetical protein
MESTLGGLRRNDVRQRAATRFAFLVSVDEGSGECLDVAIFDTAWMLYDYDEIARACYRFFEGSSCGPQKICDC